LAQNLTAAPIRQAERYEEHSTCTSEHVSAEGHVVSALNPEPPRRRLSSAPMDGMTAGDTSAGKIDPDEMLRLVALGDEAAFASFYDHISARVFGLVKRVLRDPAQAEEVTQEALVEMWRTASRYDRSKGTATGWALTIAHRRAVDRVRSEQASTDRMRRVAVPETPYDEVAEQAAAHLEYQQVRRCLRGLTSLQREAIELAYYQGHTYREVAELLGAALPTVKTRMRDALIRLRDCLGVSVG
jgi:RNA polymerase sigma-70 factor, ECF subfamily